MLYAALFPAAYFFGVVYSESLFFMTLLGAALAIRRGTLGVGGAVRGGDDGDTRERRDAGAGAHLDGVAIRAGRDRSVAGCWRRPPPARSASPCTVPTTTRSAAIRSSGTHSIQRWGYHPGGNPASGFLAIGEALVTRPYSFLTTERMAPYDTLNVLSAFGAVAAVPFIWRRLGGPYAAIVVLGLILPLSSGQYEGLGRYCAVLFPLPIYLGSLEGEMRHVVLVGVAAMLYTLGLILFVNVHPMF